MKTVVITGSARGIGRGLAENFLKRECRVVVSGRSPEAVEQVVQALEAEHPGRVAGRHCDITSAADVQALWDTARKSFGGVDIWINNAGMSIARKPLAEQAVGDLEKIVATNLTGLLIANKVVLAEMLKADHGQIWNMEGFGSNGQSAPGMVAYGATKRALTYVNASLQKEIKGSSVQVNTLSPGVVVTDLLVGDYDLSSEEWRKTKKILNILGDTVDTVTPYLVEGVLKAEKSGARVAWLTTPKAFLRFLTAGFNKRDLFVEHEANA